MSLGKTYFFVIEKYVEDVKQDQKTVADLLESIMRRLRLVKDELRRISSKCVNLGQTQFMLPTFWMPRKSTDFGQPKQQASLVTALVSFKQIPPRITFPTTINSNNVGFSPRGPLLYSGFGEFKDELAANAASPEGILQL